MKNAIISIENKIISFSHFTRLYSIFEDLNSKFFNSSNINISVSTISSDDEKEDFQTWSKGDFFSKINSFTNKSFNEIVIHYNVSDIFKLTHSLNSQSKMYQSALNFTEISSTDENILAYASDLINKELLLLEPKTKVLQYFSLISRIIISLQVLFLIIIGVSIVFARNNILNFANSSWYSSTLPFIFIGFIGVLLILGIVYNLLFHAKVPTSIYFDFKSKDDISIK